jgi:DNA invertase Pin-like site-specific DNA recombinase
MQVVTYRCGASGRDAAQELSQQANRLTVYLCQNRHVLLNDFHDIDKQGDGLATALDALRTGRGEGLLVTSIDRISRNKTEVRAVASALRSVGAVLVTVGDGIIDAEKLLTETAQMVPGEGQVAV